MIKNKLVLDINKKTLQTHIPENSRYEKNRNSFSNKYVYRFQTMNQKTGRFQKMTILQKINKYLNKVNLLLTYYINESIDLNTK